MTTGRVRPSKGAGDVRIGHLVEAQLDEIGIGDGVALPTQFRHRGRRHDYAQLGCRHKRKKPLQPFG
jgi:hypothetical protein